MKKKVKLFILSIFKKLKIIDGIPIGLKFVNFVFQKIFRINGDVRVSVNFTSRVTVYENIKHFKDRNTLLSFAVSGNMYIQGINGITFGQNIIIAPGVKIISANHDYHKRNSSTYKEPIIIGNNVWIGANAIILPGVEIGNNCVIGAGSVVTKSFKEDNLVIAGNPARAIKNILNGSNQ